jgi:hypothetical protein
MNERRQVGRRNFSYYMQVTNEHTGKLLGHLVDISTGGFKLDSAVALQENVEYMLRLELSGEIATKTSMTFGAISRWCRPDKLQPNSFNIGFQITSIAPGDLEIFSRMFERYGSPPRK